MEITRVIYRVRGKLGSVTNETIEHSIEDLTYTESMMLVAELHKLAKAIDDKANEKEFGDENS